ncbi:hypothetical protein [Pelagicoccus sp. SDUM812002]|uniref:hypothetical protein n=1 Tax=Pelagicoccus sp. SDUM812002 TaxID=3041266 RepID=UPI002810851D|nr:hypothetical protein [Pelagicoccus sp. SDUM812002]
MWISKRLDEDLLLGGIALSVPECRKFLIVLSIDRNFAKPQVVIELNGQNHAPHGVRKGKPDTIPQINTQEFELSELNPQIRGLK